MDLGKPNIVLVDDSDAMHAFFERAAKQADVALHAFRSADAAMDFLASRRPDLLFMNVIMPNKNGYTLLRELRRLPLHADTPTIMISSKDYAQDRVAAKKLGVLEFVAKPISSRGILSLIEKYRGST